MQQYEEMEKGLKNDKSITLVPTRQIEHHDGVKMD